MIGIIDYGLGNIKAFANVYKNLGLDHKIVKNSEDLNDVTKIILPGVGAFDHAMYLLNNSGIRTSLDDLVINQKVPVLGICVGMQILAKRSDEGKLDGLGWVEGEVRIFDADNIPYKTRLPHMGWNIVESKNHNPLLKDLAEQPRFYFLHSYYFSCDNNFSIAKTNYGGYFTSAVMKQNIYGVQFHPEKSHHNGIQVLKNFGNL